MKKILAFDSVSHSFQHSGLSRLFPTANGEKKPTITADSISFSISKGDIIGLVGRTGCGKSTLARIAVGLIQPDSGAVRFFEKEIMTLRGNDYRTFRQQIRMLFQDPSASLNPNMTVNQIIEEPIKLYTSLSKKDRRDKIKELLQEVNLHSCGDRYPFELSGGQKRRVSLARGLSMDPKLIIADEVTSSLDSSTKNLIMSILEERNRKYEMAMLLISHDIRLIKQWCHQINVMEKGKIVESVSTDNITDGKIHHNFTKELLASILEVN